jgi:hypothetical protein
MSTPRSRCQLPSARCCHAPGLVPPPRFLTALTACSIRRSRVCCTPLPARGSPRFLPREASTRPKTALSQADIPRDAASHPSKDPPRRQPYRVTAAVALLSLTHVPRLATTAPSPHLEFHRGFPPSVVTGGIRPARASLGDSNRSRPPPGLPCSTRSTLIPAQCRSCRSSPAREPGVARSPPLLATSRRHRGGSRSMRRRECTR